MNFLELDSLSRGRFLQPGDLNPSYTPRGHKCRVAGFGRIRSSALFMAEFGRIRLQPYISSDPRGVYRLADQTTDMPVHPKHPRLETKVCNPAKILRSLSSADVSAAKSGVAG